MKKCLFRLFQNFPSLIKIVKAFIVRLMNLCCIRGGHLVNRYCGGSHTTTTPQQRVTRTGHFLTQWGPKVIQMTEGMIMGKDGVMYHSRPTKMDVCEPTCWESSICGDTRSPVSIGGDFLIISNSSAHFVREVYISLFIFVLSFL